MNRGKIVLIAIVIYFTIFAFINVNKEKDINKEILSKVVYVKDGVLDKKNEGKLVVVSGKIKYDSLVSFLELDENFGSIKISREVKDYVKEYDEDDKEYHYKWKEREEPSTNDENYLKQILSEEKVSKVMIGNFELDKKGLSLIPTDKYYAKQEVIGELSSTGLYYTNDSEEENIKEGDMMLTYKYYNLDKHPYMSVLAVQKGNSFVPYKVDKKHQVYQVFTKVVDSKAKLSKELKLNVKRTTKGKILFIIMIIGIGVFLIVDNKKKA